jgi:hypothetical protein
MSAVGPFSRPGMPPAMAEYVSTLQPNGAGPQPPPTAYRLFRASDGKTRVDTGNLSVIHDPGAAKTIVLDHARKEAHIAPAGPNAPALPGMPQVPGMPAMPGAPQPAAMHVQDLGMSAMHGEEVQGKRYFIQPPAPPQMPQPPAAPQTPGMPQKPKLPQLPPKPPTPVSAEVWTSPKLQLPMASRVNGSFGQQTTMCQKAVPGEPNPAVFQIPHDYKQVLPAPGKLPNRPAV